jgi:hypothetical protein
MKCKHFNFEDDEAMSCKAFPDGIPEAIIESNVKHNVPYPGDNGIIFELRQ